MSIEQETCTEQGMCTEQTCVDWLWLEQMCTDQGDRVEGQAGYCQLTRF